MKRILKVMTLMVAVCVLLSGSIYTQAEPTMAREISKDILITSERSEIIIPTAEPTVAESQPNYYVDVTDGYISENSLRSICDWVGAQYDISSELLQALVWVESTNKIQATSNCNAKGLCQIVEKWHKDRMERLGGL